MSAPLLRTPLFDWHSSHGARLVDFAHWSMPVQYRSIVEEHLATRQAVGLFDVSHMGRLLLWGAGAAGFLERTLTRRVLDLASGRIRYSLVTNHQGGILDDILVYRLDEPCPFVAPTRPAPSGEAPNYQLVVNASNRAKILDWLRSLDMPRDCQLDDLTVTTAMIAVQGPAAVGLASRVLNFELAALKYYSMAQVSWRGQPCWLSRTGYTGEDGCEIIVAADQAMDVWTTILAAGESLGAVAAGLGARDTLRLEAAMPLYGHELSERVDPFQAGIGFAVDLDGRQFPGHDALVPLADRDDRPVRAGLMLQGQRPAREHSLVFHGPQQVGEVTSGSFSPTLHRPIAMAYLLPSAATQGVALDIEIRGRREAAHVVPLPFYSRSKKG